LPKMSRVNCVSGVRIAMIGTSLDEISTSLNRRHDEFLI